MKTSRHTPYGVLNPLPVPERPWRDISMDFVTGLPVSEGHDAIWVVIDRLTKMRHFVPCSTTVDGKELANLFVTNIFRLHGLPDSIISDQGPQFASRFWKYLCNSLRIEPRLSTTFHPETDGQTECTNSVME
jgi:transposase InsO family protein